MLGRNTILNCLKGQLPMNECRICKNNKNNKLYYVKERQLNEGDTFEYLYCGKCGTLQLNEVVEDMSHFYQDNYYAFIEENYSRKTLAGRIFDQCFVFVLVHSNWSAKTYERLQGSKYYRLRCLCGTKLKFSDSLLDVGCGSGNWLQFLYTVGFKNLTGVDLYAPPYKQRSWKFIQGEIEDLDEVKKYKFITLNHSFEHMQNPIAVLEKVYRLLDENGMCILRIPLMEQKAWRLYQEHWYQIDAPRHAYLYTKRAMQYLCKKTGLRVKKILFDSLEAQFRASEYYRKTNWSLDYIYKRTRKKVPKYRKMAIEANKNGEGDQAIFYIVKNS